uniref:Uncharacterized protein n=1 Tax=Anguilla anguilla TaxID=7936 RepID=A0A0E9U586_ANGAN
MYSNSNVPFSFFFSNLVSPKIIQIKLGLWP